MVIKFTQDSSGSHLIRIIEDVLHQSGQTSALRSCVIVSGVTDSSSTRELLRPVKTLKKLQLLLFFFSRARS